MASATDVLTGLLKGGGQLAAAYFPYAATEDQMKAITDMASKFATESSALGKAAQAEAAFKPIAVKTGTGTTAIGEGGALTQTLGTTPAAIQSSLLGTAKTMAGAAPTTAADIYKQLQASQAGEQARRRLELENRLAAQGRLGTTTAAYGGTPEALALEKAIQEQQSKNWLTAQTLAPQLQSQNLQNVQAALTGAYTPQTQELAALTPAAQFANIAQSAGLGESEALYKSGLGGLQAQAEAQGAVAGLEAARTKALASALGGLFAAGAGGTASPADTLISALLGTTPSTSTSSSTTSSSGGWLDSLVKGLFGGSSSGVTSAGSAGGSAVTGINPLEYMP